MSLCECVCIKLIKGNAGTGVNAAFHTKFRTTDFITKVEVFQCMFILYACVDHPYFLNNQFLNCEVFKLIWKLKICKVWRPSGNEDSSPQYSSIKLLQVRVNFVSIFCFSMFISSKIIILRPITYSIWPRSLRQDVPWHILTHLFLIYVQQKWGGSFRMFNHDATL